MTTTKTLTDQEIHDLLQRAGGWSLQDGKLVRTWAFSDFVAAMAFVNNVAELAEQANHHPDIDIRYNKVQLALVSHDAGGITRRDAEMAQQLSDRFPA